MKGNNLNFTAVQEQCASKLELAAAEAASEAEAKAELTYQVVLACSVPGP